MYYWENAIQREPDMPGVRKDLEELKRSHTLEREYGKFEYGKFKVKYDGHERRDIALKALEILNNAYFDVGGFFNRFPDKEIILVIYTRDEYRTLTDSPDWTAGKYDGRIKTVVVEYDKGGKLLFIQLKRALASQANGGGCHHSGIRICYKIY